MTTCEMPMTPSTPTPRCDATLHGLLPCSQLESDLLQLAHILERELSEARAFLASEHDAHMDCHRKMDAMESKLRILAAHVRAYFNPAYHDRHYYQHKEKLLAAADAAEEAAISVDSHD